jgi:hypothetical protein
VDWKVIEMKDVKLHYPPIMGIVVHIMRDRLSESAEDKIILTQIEDMLKSPKNSFD